jgi:hypothetical protein
MRNLLLQLIICSLILVSSCKQHVGPKEYFSLIEQKSSGLVQDDEMGGVLLSCYYKPVEAIVLTEALKNGGLPSEAELEVEKEKLNRLRRFHLKLKGKTKADVLRENCPNEEEYSLRFQYYTNEIQKDLFLIINSDTIPSLFTHFERSMGTKPESTLIIDFEIPSNVKAESKTFTLLWDKTKFNNKSSQFIFNNSAIDNLPKINL